MQSLNNLKTIGAFKTVPKKSKNILNQLRNRPSGKYSIEDIRNDQ